MAKARSTRGGSRSRATVSANHASHVRAISRAERSGTPDHVVASMHEAAASAARAEGNHAAAERHTRTASVMHENRAERERAAAHPPNPTGHASSTSHHRPSNPSTAARDAAAHSRLADHASMGADPVPGAYRESAHEHGARAKGHEHAARTHAAAAEAHRAAGNHAEAERHMTEARHHARVSLAARKTAVQHVARHAAQHTVGITGVTAHGNRAPAAVQTGKHGGHYTVGPGGTKHYLPS